MKFYRYEAVEYASTDMDGEYVAPTFPHPKLEVREFDVVKETPKGYWVGYMNPFGHRIGDWQKWVSKTAKKRYAYPTKQEALVNYIKRTERRIKILDWQLQVCKISLNIAKARMAEPKMTDNDAWWTGRNRIMTFASWQDAHTYWEKNYK